MERANDLRGLLHDLYQERLDALLATAETGAQWAEICLLEKLLIEAKEEAARDEGQFGVGA